MRDRKADLQKMFQTNSSFKHGTCIYYGAHLTINAVAPFPGLCLQGYSENTNVVFTGQGDGSGLA